MVSLRVTASQLLARLEERGLVEVVGARSGGRGPSAELYAVDRAGISTSRVSQLVIGTPGLVDPATGDVDFSWDLPRRRAGLGDTLRRDLGCGVTIENDVNLAAMAERAEGAACGVDDVLLLWVSRGVGLAVVLGGRLHRGATGAAGEIGYLPVPGVPLPSSVERPFKGAFQRLVGAEAALDAGPHGAPFLDEPARRLALALGVAGACAVVDPALVVLAGEVGASGGERLCGLVSSAVGHIAPRAPARRLHGRCRGPSPARRPALRGRSRPGGALRLHGRHLSAGNARGAADAAVGR